MKLLAASKLVTQRKIRRLQELNVDFVAAEARMFHFMRPQGLRNVFMPTSEEIRAIELSQTSQQLVSFCLTMKEFPFVRFANRAPIAKKFAIQFEVTSSIDSSIITSFPSLTIVIDCTE
jgi:hypothetical protein